MRDDTRDTEAELRAIFREHALTPRQKVRSILIARGLKDPQRMIRKGTLRVVDSEPRP